MRVERGDDEVDEVYRKGEIKDEFGARNKKQYEYGTATRLARLMGVSRKA